jgi:peptidoglycan hydrolase FlgJ
MSLSTSTASPVTHQVADSSRILTDPKARLKASADEYEATFLNTMFSQMFEGLPTEGIGHGGPAEETWRGMLVNEYAKSVTKAGGIGLSKAIYTDLVRIQESTRQ